MNIKYQYLIASGSCDNIITSIECLVEKETILDIAGETDDFINEITFFILNEPLEVMAKLN